jgi:hypothetical protein
MCTSLSRDTLRRFSAIAASESQAKLCTADIYRTPTSYRQLTNLEKVSTNVYFVHGKPLTIDALQNNPKATKYVEKR